MHRSLQVEVKLEQDSMRVSLVSSYSRAFFIAVHFPVSKRSFSEENHGIALWKSKGFISSFPDHFSSNTERTERGV
ncbi:hypothetical protein Bca4012_015454 [Brassica carinata]